MKIKIKNKPGALNEVIDLYHNMEIPFLQLDSNNNPDFQLLSINVVGDKKLEELKKLDSVIELINE
jgi:uncharacterized protein with ACT and thioredoxin-like domain